MIKLTHKIDSCLSPTQTRSRILLLTDLCTLHNPYKILMVLTFLLWDLYIAECTALSKFIHWDAELTSCSSPCFLILSRNLFPQQPLDGCWFQITLLHPTLQMEPVRTSVKLWTFQTYRNEITDVKASFLKCNQFF